MLTLCEQLDLVRDFGDIRKPDMAPTPLDGLKFKTDYLVEGFSWGGDICLVLGSNESVAAYMLSFSARTFSPPGKWQRRCGCRVHVTFSPYALDCSAKFARRTFGDCAMSAVGRPGTRKQA